MDRSDLLELERNSEIAEFQPGNTLRVHVKVVEGERERTQVFEGVCLRIQRKGSSSNFTVRRVTQGIGVERTFLYHSPRVEKVEVTRHGRVRRAKLYYLRDRTGRAARVPERTRYAQRKIHSY
ncbi:MAG: 50S ribosomal protein L19 [Chloroflexi bacterium]|nr:50S ribosomal protein L19 [Chloroflexota bacterium]